MGDYKGGFLMNDFKKPGEMTNIELLEKYSHYTKLGFRATEEQEYLTLLQQEILKRMGSQK